MKKKPTDGKEAGRQWQVVKMAHRCSLPENAANIDTQRQQSCPVRRYPVVAPQDAYGPP